MNREKSCSERQWSAHPPDATSLWAKIVMERGDAVKGRWAAGEAAGGCTARRACVTETPPDVTYAKASGSGKPRSNPSSAWPEADRYTSWFPHL